MVISRYRSRARRWIDRVARVKVLLSAYACEPGKGSEQEVGLRVLLAAASRHDVWVLTRQNNIGPLVDFLAGNPLAPRIRLHGIDSGGPAGRLKGVGKVGLHLYYDAWQRLAGRAAAELDRQVNFDLVHHATFATYWTRAGVTGLGKPMVWGPVGGAVPTPARLLPELGAAGLWEEAWREAVRRVALMRPSVRAAMAAATVCLAQNRRTARRLRHPNVSVLPNALTVRLPPLPSPEPRSSDVAVVGRLIPLKGGPLAVRAFRHVQHPDSVLRVFGDGPDRERIRRAAERWGLRDRVDLVGNLPRDELLPRLRRCGVLLYPSFHDEAGLGVAEALSLGVPVVCLDNSGPAEVVRWFPTGHAALVRPSTPEATARRLAAAVQAFLDNPPTPPAEPVGPTTSFESLILDAYDRALSARDRG
jgi:glycosyltransferase involved in cell wall biosynthesis